LRRCRRCKTPTENKLLPKARLSLSQRQA